MIRVVMIGVVGLWLLAAQPAGGADPVQFNRDIRPILADKCFACHGPDNNKRESDLRLDTGEGAFEQRDDRAVLVPGKPDASELIRRITSTDDDERMPPASTQKTVTPRQVELLRQWISQGAEYEPHWSLIAPRRADPPAAGGDWVRNDIDRFVAAAHGQRRLAPAVDADRRTLARRLSLDLLGLPPTPDEVDAFVADTSPKAYEDLVDRLLASPHFGERLASYWLDVVRYADSGGYHSDNERELSPYRDYVISAFNDNLPFDQFTIEQIAGDLLPDATNRQKIASGYNRLLQTTEEGGAQPKEYAAKYQADRVRNTSVAWLAITMGCCECHTHKYDPFSIRDFYSLAAFFADVQEKAVGRQEQTALATPEQAAQLAELAQQLAPLRQDLLRDTPQLAAGQSRWEQQLLADLAAGKSDWQLLKPDNLSSTGGATLSVQEDLSVLSSGENPDRDAYTITLPKTSQPITAMRLEALRHDSLAKQSLSRSNGNFVLTEIEITAQSAEDKKPQPIKITAADADFSQDGYPIANAIDGKSDTGWAVAGHEKPADRRALFRFERPIAADAVIVVKLKHDSKFAGHNIGRFRLAASTVPQPGLSETGGLSAGQLDVLKTPASERSPEQAALLTSYYRKVAPELAPLRDQIASLERRQQEIEQAFPKTLVTKSTEPRMVRVLPRGNWLDESGEIVQPATPQSLPATEIANRQLARLDLAHWFVRRDQPLTARVFVNRLWKLMFGQGIVKTLDDFGTQGAMPTHPELLDWLAVEFMDSGWDVKHMVKLLVMSRTYQQNSAVSQSERDRDPANQWLTRQAAFRLDAEFVRDNALAISGMLSRHIGGPSVKPYQPAGYWRFLNFPTREWQNDHGDNLYRRGLYTHWQRTFLQPSLVAFDAPSREECTVDRPRSNTPLQALVLLNDPTYVEAARVLAMRTFEQPADSAQARVVWAFRRALQRKPNDTETQVLVNLYEKHREEYARDKTAASAVAQVGEWPLPASVDHVELAAWTSVCRTILNLHETITRY